MTVMTNKEAKAYVSAYMKKECQTMPRELIEALSVLLEANNKQIPMGEVCDMAQGWSCPDCGALIGKDIFLYCPNCGKKIGE